MKKSDPTKFNLSTAADSADIPIVISFSELRGGHSGDANLKGGAYFVFQISASIHVLPCLYFK